MTSSGIHPNDFPVATSIAAGTFAAAVVAKIAGGTRYGYAYCAELAVCKQAVPLTQAAAKYAGMTYGAAVAVSSSAADLTAPCLTLQGAGVNAVVPGVNNPVMLAQQCAAQGYKPIYVVAQATLQQPGILTSPYTDNRLWSLSSQFPPFIDSPAVNAFRKTLKKYGPSIQPDFSASGAWTSGLLFQAAAERIHGKVTPAALISSLRSLKKETLGGLAPGTLNYSNPTFHLRELLLGRPGSEGQARRTKGRHDHVYQAQRLLGDWHEVTGVLRRAESAAGSSRRLWEDPVS